MLSVSPLLAQTTTQTPPAATQAPPATAQGPGSSITTGPAVASKPMTDQEVQAWVGKAVYGSDGKNIGEIAAIKRDTQNMITEVEADIGGFLGIGETRVRVMPNQFRMESDRVVLNLTEPEAKQLPKVAK